jgi:hypothetical protein
MADKFVETTSTSWGSRIMSSIKGILVGIIMFFGSFYLLVWNEGNAIRTTQANEEGASIVKSLPEPKMNAENEGKLIHIQGIATTNDEVADTEFGIKETALKLNRVVEFYQWKQTEKSTTKKKLGGGEETVTEYTYSKEWSADPVNSDEFRIPDDHRNSQRVNYEDYVAQAQTVTLGEFGLSTNLIGQISKSENLAIAEDAATSKGGVVKNNFMYFGSKDDVNPQVGDARIHYEVVRPMEVSIVAKQTNATLDAYATESGKTLELLYYGKLSAQEIFAKEEQMNTVLTWALRAGGFFLMFLGLSMVLKPISVLGDVVPFIGNLLGAGIGLIAGVIAFGLSLITIAIAWVAYRPVLGVSLLAIATAAIYMIVRSRKKKAKEKMQAPLHEPVAK